MHMTRPYFRGRSALSNIVDNNNTIENIRKEKEDKKEKEKSSRKKNKDNTSSYTVESVLSLTEDKIKYYLDTGDVSKLILERKMIKAYKLLNIKGFVTLLASDKEYLEAFEIAVQMVINRRYDSSLFGNEIKDWSIDRVTRKMNLAFNSVFIPYEEKELAERRK